MDLIPQVKSVLVRCQVLSRGHCAWQQSPTIVETGTKRAKVKGRGGVPAPMGRPGLREESERGHVKGGRAAVLSLVPRGLEASTPPSRSRAFGSPLSCGFSLTIVHDSASQAISPAMTTPSHRVLLLLDVQEGMFTGRKAVPAAAQVRGTITTILNHARYKANPPPLIIHVRNDGGSGEPDELSTPGWQLIHKTLPGEQIVDKSKNNAFAGTKLGKLIPEDAEIVVVGLQSDFCVRATCSAALSRGNTVLLIRGSHTTFDRLEVLHGDYHHHLSFVASTDHLPLIRRGNHPCSQD